MDIHMEMRYFFNLISILFTMCVGVSLGDDLPRLCLFCCQWRSHKSVFKVFLSVLTFFFHLLCCALIVIHDFFLFPQSSLFHLGPLSRIYLIYFQIHYRFGLILLIVLIENRRALESISWKTRYSFRSLSGMINIMELMCG